ncbi:MAG: hypothetical protein AAFN93_10370, partial [Bacteroidota bacterium]
NLPELLHQLGCSLAISTYQAGKVIFISAKDANTLVQLNGGNGVLIFLILNKIRLVVRPL